MNALKFPPGTRVQLSGAMKRRLLASGQDREALDNQRGTVLSHSYRPVFRLVQWDHEAAPQSCHVDNLAAADDPVHRL
jgi:hypothetical protein